MTDFQHLEQAAIDRLKEWGGDKLLHQMIRLYLTNSTERLEQIEQGLTGEDLDLVERGAHSLKSSAANVGAMGVSKLANEMEDAAEDGDWETIRSRHPGIVEACAAAATELNTLIEGQPES